MVTFSSGMAGGGGSGTATYTTNTVNSTLIDDLFMIGFNSMFNNRNKISGGFPFYNVVKIDEDTFGIEIAVAGFAEEDIEISEQNSSLTVKGESKDDERNYIYRGITSKSFTRNFALAEHVHVSSARLKDGMLQIIVKREIPEEKKPKRIAIES